MKKVRMRIFPFFIALPIIVVLVGAFIRNQLNMSWIYDALGKLGILGYYGTIFGIYWAMISYNQTQEKEREKEKKEREEKWKQENENREKKYKKEEKARKEDLENYKNSFRPMFALNDEGNKLIVLLGRDDLYIEKVRYYATDEDQGVFYRSLKNNSEIKIEHPKDFFVTAETLVGETILFGIVLGGIKVYMALREGGNL